MKCKWIKLFVFIFWPFLSQAQWFAENDTFQTHARFLAQANGFYFLNSNGVPTHIVNRFLFGGSINQQSIDGINQKNATSRFGFDASYGFSFRWRADTLTKRTFSVAFQNSYLGGGRSPFELLQLGLNGNNYFDSQPINLAPVQFRFYHLQSIDFGMSFQTKNWTITPTLGLSRMIDYNQIEVKTFNLFSSLDSLNYQVDAQTNASKNSDFKQNGLAVQTGINLQYHQNKWWAALSVQRLGFVVNKWQTTQNNYSADTSFTGFRVNDLNSLSLLNIEDSLKLLVNQTKRNTNQQGLMLPASFQLKISRLLNNNTDKNLYLVHAGSAFQTHLFQRPLIYLSGQWIKNSKNNFSIESMLFTGPYSTFDVGLKVSMAAFNKHCIIRFAAPSLSGFINPNKYGNSSLQIQLAYQW